MAAERKISTRIEMKGDAEYRRKMKQVNKEMETFSGWAGTMAGVLSAKAITKGLELVASGFKAAWDASVAFETALIGVAKTTNMSDVQLKAFGRHIQELSTQIPMSAEELLALAETAGQLGVADKDIENFVKVVAAMGVSTNLSADGAATALAQIGNVMGTTVYEYERMGSSIVALGNTTASTEADIVSLTQRLAGAAALVGISEADVLAYAAAMSSVGIEAEAGGTALSKVWREIETLVATGGSELTGFAELAGMSAARFAEVWQQDASGAFQLFMAGLADTESTGKSAIATLAGLGITEARTTDAITRLIGASGLLETSLETSNTAWNNNTALAEEAGKFYSTTASQIEMAENAVNNLAVAAGDKFKPIVTSAMQGGKAAVEALYAAIIDQPSLAEIGANTDAAFTAQADEIERTANQAYWLTDRLEELGDVTKLTGSEQQEYLATLQLLKDIMPSAAGIIDLQTGAIEGGTNALRENIATSKENSVQLAELDSAREKYDALTIAQENYAAKRAIYAVALSEEAALTSEYTALEQKAADMRAEFLKEAGGDQMLALDIEMASEEFAELQRQMGAATTDIAFAQEKTNNLNEELTEEAAALEAASGYADDYAAKLEGMGEALTDAAGSGAAMTEEMQGTVDEFQAMSDRVDELAAELVLATDAARAQVESVVNGFGAIEMPEPVSATDTIANLQSQLDYMAEYAANLKKVQELGLDQTLVEQLSDGSTESAGILAGIVEDGGANIDTLNEKFAEVTTGKEAMATAMAEAQTDFQTKTDLIVDATNKMVENFNQEDGAKTAAADTIQGVIDGMNSKLAALRLKHNQINALMNFGNTPTVNKGSKGGGAPQGAYASGLAYVPADGYIAELHRGEMVLTALEARAYRAEQYANYGMLAALERADTTNIQNDNRKTYAPSGDTFNVDVDVSGGNATGKVVSRQIVEGLSAYTRRRARGRGKIL